MTMTTGYLIASAIDDSIFYLCVYVLGLAIVLIPLKIRMDNKAEKEFIQYREGRRIGWISGGKKLLRDIILNEITEQDRQELLEQLSKTGHDLFFVFKFPERLSGNNEQVIRKVLKVAFNTTTDDKYLWKWFDAWIKDYVTNVFIPVLQDNKQ